MQDSSFILGDHAPLLDWNPQDLPWLDRSIDRVYRVDLTMDLKRADWGPSR